MDIFSILFGHFGHQGWWPGQGETEISVGAILTQNTNWNNASRAIQELKNYCLLTPQKIRELDEEKLASLIQSAGYYNQKARKLKYFMQWLKEYHDDWRLIRKENTIGLRRELLSVWGIGKETADSILLYALEKPVFVIDTYTRRILSRHYLCSPKEKYDNLQTLFMENLPQETSLYNEYHALLVQAGKHYCRKKPACEKCPLWGFNGKNQGSQLSPP